MLTIQYLLQFTNRFLFRFRYYSVSILIQIQRSWSLVLLICTRKRPSRVRGPEMVTFNTWPYWRRNEQGDKLLSGYFRVVMMQADTKPCVARRLDGLGVSVPLCPHSHWQPLSSTAQLTSRLCPGLSTRAVDLVTPAAATSDAILLLHSRDM